MEIFHKVTGKNVDSVKIRLDKNKHVNIAKFLRSMGMQKETIIEYFGDGPTIQATIDKDKSKTEDEALEFLHRTLRKGDRVTEESKKNLISNLLFNKRRYNLSKTGRYMLNMKLNLIERITGTILAEDLKNKKTNTVIFKKGTKIDKNIATNIQESFNTGILQSEKLKDITSNIYAKQLENNPILEKRVKIISVFVYPSEE
jgi:DNA-directed RNA polymerase subunit beta